MTSMRPFQIILISVFAALAIGGLFVFATFKGFGGAKSVPPVTIWGTVPETAIQPAIDELRRNHKEFTSITYSERDPASFDSDLAEALASGDGPDLILTNQERLLAERSKLSLIPFSVISERNYRDTYVPAGESYLAAGGTYAIPLAVDPLLLYYNRGLLASGGLSQPPSTWEAIVGITPHLTSRNGGYLTKSAIPLGTYENIGNARAIISMLLLQSGNPITEATDGSIRPTLLTAPNTINGISPAESAIGFYTQFADPAKTVYTWNRSRPEARQAFVAGDTTFYVGFASERSLIMASNPNLDLDIAPVPQPQTAGTRMNYALVYGFALPKGKANAEGALQVALALTGKGEAVPIVQALGMAPALRSLLSASNDDVYAAVIYPQALIARGWLSPAPAATDRIFADMINSIISGRESVHDAVQAADQSLSAALP
jgi:ABC-type glycerol-3-phosphate transport system substrate-binding protein